MSWCCFTSLKTTKNLYCQTDLPNFPNEKNLKIFSLKELTSATNSFSRDNKIGRGGFGIVYKGVLKSGERVAIKVLSAESRQGTREFLAEIEVITNVKHPNLVELVGCCVQGQSRMLVYEYLENGSLDHALFGLSSDTTIFTWDMRSSICIGIARGLAYLHEELKPPIVHRDIKASNVLLDRNYAPKIGDFGLAKLFPDNATHISTRVAGTTGYLAPEYASNGQLTKKADVYSFGVLVLEIISGRISARSSLLDDGKPLLRKAWELHQQSRLKELIDPALAEYPEDDVLQHVKVALFCTQLVAGRRPSMQQVVHMLSQHIRLNEKELTPPGYMDDQAGRSSPMTLTTSMLKNFSSGAATGTAMTTPPMSLEMSPR